MKIILSRKGFDAGTGKVASPIFPSGEMRSLPIPQPEPSRLPHPIRYGHVRVGDQSLGHIVSDLTRGKLGPDDPAHLDPDLESSSLPRPPHWRPIFGQAGAAERHLRKHGVQAGDVFVFYGWFRRVERFAGKYCYMPGAPDLHVIFGWLQVEQVIPLHSLAMIPQWTRYHPHCQSIDPTRIESLYISTPSVRLRGADLGVAGGGVFQRFADGLRLTARGHNRSGWRLPGWLYPREGQSRLSYHENLSRWTMDGDDVLLRSAARGQEFVLDCDDYPESLGWLSQLLRSTDTKASADVSTEVTLLESAGA